MPSWIDHAIWWHLHPLGFVGAEDRGLPDEAPTMHRLDQVSAWLPYVRDLGVNGVVLGPVFASESHGYDTIDHYRVDARLGDEDDLRALVDACRTTGVRVLLDGVFNHVGRGSPQFRDVLERGRESRHADWFHLYGDGPGDQLDYEHFEGHRGLVTLNHDNPAVEDHVVDVMRHWLDAGIDGWRLDAAYAVPTPFWARVTDRVHSTHPDAWLVGEVIHGPYEPIIEEGGLDSVTQYELWKATWSALNDRNLHELAWTLGRHADLLDVCLPMTFIGNHDVTRIATRLDDPRHLDLAVAILCTLPGTPSIYAGDEQAFTGTKEDRPGGDDAVRPAFPATPDGLPPDGWPTYRVHQRLLGLRRRHPGIARGQLRVLHVTNDELAYVVEGGDDRVVVLLNVGDDPMAFDDADVMPTGDVEVAVSVDADDEGDPGGDTTVVPAHGWRVTAGRAAP